jgi:hypothetical protein
MYVYDDATGLFEWLWNVSTYCGLTVSGWCVLGEVLVASWPLSLSAVFLWWGLPALCRLGMSDVARQLGGKVTRFKRVGRFVPKL